ncbi:MAG: lipid carrier--UDP-N-acetylgalactosaminyltransferase [Bacteroidetes bacterium]|nr:MAG: lipid carrier--UDP-N-acetylgalactosaminyltransferase [Bacteroidota bacterium]
MYPFLKRAFDLVFAVVLLIILSPLLIPIVILLRLTGEGYVFYYQKRIGYRNQNFNMIKFATMLKNSPNMGTGSITLRNDPRLLPMGKFLRMTKINELPQLFNVLKGEMSVVGPRPLVTATFDAYPEDIRYRVYDSKPGITGIGSVVFRDEEELISKAAIAPHEFYRQTIAPYKGELEIWYNKRKSLWVDIQIVFLTLWVILFPKSKLIYKSFKDLPQRNLEV